MGSGSWEHFYCSPKVNDWIGINKSYKWTRTLVTQPCLSKDKIIHKITKQSRCNAINFGQNTQNRPPIAHLSWHDMGSPLRFQSRLMLYHCNCCTTLFCIMMRQELVLTMCVLYQRREPGRRDHRVLSVMPRLPLVAQGWERRCGSNPS